MKKKTRTKWSLQNKQRREKLLEQLRLHGWSIPQAGIAAGYSKAYALRRLTHYIQNDKDFCDRIIGTRREMEAASGDTVELVKRAMTKIISTAGETSANRIRAGDVLCKIAGVYSEKRVIEDVTRQRELDGQERIEALLLAKLRLRALPAPGVCVALPAVYPQFTEQGDMVTLDGDSVSRTAPEIDDPGCNPPVNEGDSGTSSSDNSSETGTTPSAPGEGIPPNDGSAHRSPPLAG